MPALLLSNLHFPPPPTPISSLQDLLQRRDLLSSLQQWLLPVPRSSLQQLYRRTVSWLPSMPGA